MSVQLAADVLGWIGSVEVILAYGLISSQKVDGKSVLYQVLNLTGAIFLIINTIYYGAFPSTAINVVWVVIAFLALWKIYFRKSK